MTVGHKRSLVFELPASTFGRAAIEEDDEVIKLTVGPDDKLALIYEVHLHGIPRFRGLPNERQLITRLQLEALRQGSTET